MPCGTNEVARAVSGSIAQAPPSEPIGTRDIASTPPARIRLSQPDRTRAAAVLTASSPEAQKRLSCTPPTWSGRLSQQRRGAGQVAALLADGRDDAHHEVVEPVGVQPGQPLAQGVDQAGDQRDRLDPVQRTGVAAATARGADGVVDIRLAVRGHGRSAPS
nr:hypothetical protein GCM10020092_041450 [Actinoplanes digitatis]